MGRRMRMTLPKKEEDLQKVVEEVMEAQHEHHHHHHHHHAEGLDEILHTIDVLMDTMNSRITDLEEKTEILRGEITRLYKLFAAIVEALASNTEEERVKALEEARKILMEGMREIQPSKV